MTNNQDKKRDFVKICPNCGSTDISWKIIGETGWEVQYCRTCRHGYPDGTIFPEIDGSKIDEFRKHLKEAKK